MATSDADEKYMALALELAEKGRGKVEPNPMVGAVLVKTVKLLGKAITRYLEGRTPRFMQYMKVVQTAEEPHSMYLWNPVRTLARRRLVLMQLLRRVLQRW